MALAALENLDQLRNAITFAQDDAIRFELSLITSEIEDAIVAFRKEPCAATLAKLNGHWAHGSAMLAVSRRMAKAKRR